jgi:hypothetical protein
MRVSRTFNVRNERNAFFALLGFALAAMLLPLPYMNVTASPRGEPVFEQLDRNGDGYVDRKEAAAARGLPAGFERLDRNGDARLDRVEFARW